jgi:hypothetical protein
MSKVDDINPIKKTEPKKCRTKFLSELEKLKKSPLYAKALEEVISLEKKKNSISSFEINFSVQFPTLFGEKMAVVGGHVALGNWDPSRAVEMNWNDGNVWKCTVISESNMADIPYKYVCIRGALVRWENGDNRIVDLKVGERVGNKVKVSNEDVWKR